MMARMAALHMISTHTSLVGCDVDIPHPAALSLIFLLTHPLWDVTVIPVVSADPV